jgi:hypothetical protein
MSNKPTGGPAFPRSGVKDGYGKVVGDESGMTLRDWFAGQALAGFCSGHDANGSWTWDAKEAAISAYAMADAMMESRK